jgi:hypothetical protein
MVDKIIETKKEEVDRYIKATVPETVKEVVLDNKTEKVYSDIDLLVLILNKLEKVERSVA